MSSPRSAGSSCSMPAARRATAARSSRSIPSPAISRPPGTRRPTPTSARIDDCSRRPSWPSGSMRSGSALRARSSPRAGAASRPASPAWPCGSPGSRTRSSTRAHTAIGAAPGLPVAIGPEPGEPPTGQPATGLAVDADQAAGLGRDRPQPRTGAVRGLTRRRGGRGRGRRGRCGGCRRGRRRRRPQRPPCRTAGS